MFTMEPLWYEIAYPTGDPFMSRPPCCWPGRCHLFPWNQYAGRMPTGKQGLICCKYDYLPVGQKLWLCVWYEDFLGLRKWVFSWGQWAGEEEKEVWEVCRWELQEQKRSVPILCWHFFYFHEEGRSRGESSSTQGEGRIPPLKVSCSLGHEEVSSCTEQHTPPREGVGGTWQRVIRQLVI